eukprot:TRINITY_DN7970_c0_g1_i1.p1 TRINITY_DN7970_c0_g1~~TRINITY_DN7970_c0_g1_i1.p1  ORF type:complete len:850 (-),score=160.98 TRINITY_DN7970_c0_g1_i1:78-2627(-)
MLPLKRKGPYDEIPPTSLAALASSTASVPLGAKPPTLSLSLNSTQSTPLQRPSINYATNTPMPSFSYPTSIAQTLPIPTAQHATPSISHFGLPSTNAAIPSANPFMDALSGPSAPPALSLSQPLSLSSLASTRGGGFSVQTPPQHPSPKPVQMNSSPLPSAAPTLSLQKLPFLSPSISPAASIPASLSGVSFATTSTTLVASSSTPSTVPIISLSNLSNTPTSSGYGSSFKQNFQSYSPAAMTPVQIPSFVDERNAPRISLSPLVADNESRHRIASVPEPQPDALPALNVNQPSHEEYNSDDHLNSYPTFRAESSIEGDHPISPVSTFESSTDLGNFSFEPFSMKVSQSNFQENYSKQTTAPTSRPSTQTNPAAPLQTPLHPATPDGAFFSEPTNTPFLFGHQSKSELSVDSGAHFYMREPPSELLSESGHSNIRLDESNAQDTKSGRSKSLRAVCLKTLSNHRAILFSETVFSNLGIKDRQDIVGFLMATSQLMMSDLMKLFHPKFTKLDVMGSAEFSDTVMKSMFSECQGFSHITLKHCHQVSEQSILDLTISQSNLKELMLPGCAQISDHFLQSFCADKRRLRTLDLTGAFRVTDRGVQSIASNLPSLETLVLDWCTHITDASLNSLAVSDLVHSLSRLSLRQVCKITNDGLSNLLTRCRLSHLALENNNNVTNQIALICSHNQTDLISYIADECPRIEDFGVTQLVQKCPLLRQLSLSMCSSLGESTLHSIASCSRSLQVLNLRGCVGITDNGVKSVLSLCFQLHTVILDGCRALTDSAFPEEKDDLPCLLQSIDLSFCRGVSASAIIQFVSKHLNMHTLILFGNTPFSPFLQDFCFKRNICLLG